MKAYRCKCGIAQMWNSGEMIHACEGCIKCGTTFAQYSTDHRMLQPHQLKEITKTETVDGVEKVTAHYNHCKVCSFREDIK